MFTLLQTVVLLVLSFLFGSVINMMMLAKKYENRVVKEEIEATQNRGDNMNGLSRIKNMSTKRFYRSIFGIVLLALITVGYVLYTQEVIANDYSAYVYVVIGLFAAYVLLVEKTITVIHIPIFRMWKDGKPARKEKRAERKAQKEAEKKYNKSVAPSAQLQRFECQQNHNQGHTGIASKDGFKAQHRGHQGQHDQTYTPPS